MAAISFDKNLIEQNTSGASTMVGFDIDKMKTDTHLLLEQYHIFSKTPAAPTTALGGARNKAGHTTTSSDIWSQEIPAFFKAYSDDDLTRFATLAKKNDLVLLAYKKSDTEPNGAVLKFTDGAWTKIHDSIASIPDGTEFYNSVDTKPVIRFHRNSAAVILSGDNNNTDGSNGFSAKICSWDESSSAPFPASALKFVPQFVSSMDKMINGIPSSGYDAIVKVGTTEDDILAESPSSPAGYIANNYAGIIHFNTPRSDGQIYVHAFEYIGDKLDASLSGIRKDVQDIIGTTMEGVVASVGTNEAAQNAGIGVDSTTKTSPKITFTAGSVATGETKLVTGDAVKTYVDTTALTPETGSIAKAIADYVAENAKVSVNEVEAKKVTVASGSQTGDLVQIVVTNDKTKAEDGEIGIKLSAQIEAAQWDEATQSFKNPDAVLVAGVAQTVINNTIINQITEVVGPVPEGEKPTIATAIKKGITDATLADADNAIATATGDAADKLVTAEQVKEYVDENAKVTLTAATAVGSTGITISPNATESTEFTIGIDQTVIATKKSVDDLSGIVSGLPATIKAAQDAADAAKVEAQAKVASVSGPTTGLVTVTGDKEVTISVSDTIATKSDITTEINKLSAADGIITTLTTRVGEAEASASASEAAAKGAQSAAEAAKTASEAAQAASEAAKTASESAASNASDSATAASDSATAASNSEKAAKDAQKQATASAQSASSSAQSAADSEAAALQAAADAKAAKEFVEATAEWQAGTDDTLGNFTDATKSGVVTGTTVKTVADEVLTLAKSYSDSLHTTSLDYVVLGDNETLPEASAATLGKIYLVKEGKDANGETAIDALSGSYVEYMTRKIGDGETATYTWEKIGTTDADLSAYAKKADLNVTSTTANGLTYSQTNGVVSVSVDAASTSKVGTVQLTSGYTETDDTKAATGKSIATAIDALDSSKSVNGITVNQENGVITSVTEELITASLPEGTTKVEGNVAYVGDVKHVIAPEKFQTATRMPTTLTSWVADLPNLTVGDNMFFDCGFTTFVGDLSSLTSGAGMF